MPTYIVLLRAVNVGRNPLKMSRLREICAALGLANARTYAQSGNLVFKAAGLPARWRPGLERAIAKEVRLPVCLIVRTPAEVRAVLARDPFAKRPGIDRSRLHVTFLTGRLKSPGRAALAAIAAGRDERQLAGNHVYLHCPDGYGRSKLSNNAIEKAVGMRATTRNWNTVNALFAMATE